MASAASECARLGSSVVVVGGYLWTIGRKKPIGQLSRGAKVPGAPMLGGAPRIGGARAARRGKKKARPSEANESRPTAGGRAVKVVETDSRRDAASALAKAEEKPGGTARGPDPIR